MHYMNQNVPSVLVRMLWPRLNFFKSRSKVKVTRSKIVVPNRRLCHKEYTPVI